jgi:hypothetical protein
MRSHPPVIANLRTGDEVTVLESRMGWSLVRTQDDKLGYVATSSLSPKASAPAVAASAPAPSAAPVPAPVLSRQSMKPTNDKDKPFPSGAAFFIEDMDDDLDGYLRAEIIKEKVPMRLVLAAEQADFVITGASQSESKRTWHEGWLTATRDHEVGNITAIHRESNEIVWASEAGDRSLWWGAMKRGGIRKVADRLTNNLKDSIKK